MASTVQIITTVAVLVRQNTFCEQPPSQHGRYYFILITNVSLMDAGMSNWINSYSLQKQTTPQTTPHNQLNLVFLLAINGLAVAAQWERGARLMEQPLPRCWSANIVPRAFFLWVAIGCRLSLKIDRNLPPSWEGGLSVATWYDTTWIGGTVSG